MAPGPSLSPTAAEAIDHYLSALQVFTAETHPIQYGAAVSALGTIYASYWRQDPVTNINEAIQWFSKALDVYDQQSHPDNWAEIQNYLGVLYYYCATGSHEINLDKAIVALENAKQVYTWASFPTQWKAITENLYAIVREASDKQRIDSVIRHSTWQATQVVVPPTGTLPKGSISAVAHDLRDTLVIAASPLLLPDPRLDKISAQLNSLAEESKPHPWRTVAVGTILTILGALAGWLTNLLGTPQDILHRLLSK